MSRDPPCLPLRPPSLSSAGIPLPSSQHLACQTLSWHPLTGADTEWVDPRVRDRVALQCRGDTGQEDRLQGFLREECMATGGWRCGGLGRGGVESGSKMETKPLGHGGGARLREPWPTLVLC